MICLYWCVWHLGSGSEGAQTTLQEEYHKVGMYIKWYLTRYLVLEYDTNGGGRKGFEDPKTSYGRESQLH